MAKNKRVLDALLRNSFEAFIEKCFVTLNPGQVFVPGWHISAIAFELDQVISGKTTRLIINLAPRSLKSIIASVAWPAFILGHDPSRRIICASYSGDLGKKHSNDFRAIVEAAWYRDLFPGMRISASKNTETEIATTKRGYRLATSVDGTLTGRGGDLIIVDDALKGDDANSPAKLQRVNLWFGNTLLSRLDDKRRGAIVVVGQRIHSEDLVGFLTRQSNDWRVLSLAAIAEADETIQIGPRRYHHRRTGEVLSPEREPLTILESYKRTLGSSVFAAQFQQAPIPPGGLMVRRDWIKRYTELPPYNEQIMYVQSWDTASKGGPDNDWSVCITFVYCTNRRWYVVDVWRKQVNYPDLKLAVQELATRFKAKRVLVEQAGTAFALIDELRGKVTGLVGIKPEKDKVSRMSVASSIIQSGCLYLPERAPWLADFEAELFSFPGGAHDDQCDALSQALNDAHRSFWSYITPERWKEIRNSLELRSYYKRKDLY